MNRVFPGRPDGTVTEKIADFFQRTLLPMADIVLDMHSGGKTLEFLPFAAAHVLEDKALETRAMAAMKAFNAPYSVRMIEIDAVGMYDTATEEMGKVFVTTELGGGGTSSARTVGIAKTGVRNLLIHAGILEGESVANPTTVLDMPDGRCFTFAEGEGLLEPCVDLGQPVRKGEAIARLHVTGRTGVRPTEYVAQMNGILAGRHFPGLVKTGDCLAVLAVPIG